MLTYTPNGDHAAAKPTEKPWLLLLLTFVWLWPGIIGHDPWRPDEPFVVAVVTEMLKTGNWIVPTIQGQVYLQSAPLYYWLAAIFVKLFSPWLLTVADAARLATPLCMSLALWLAGLAGRELIGRRHGRTVVLILIGCFGLIVTGHEMNPVVATFAGYAAAFYALVLGLRSPAIAGAVLGMATAWLLLSGSLLDVILVWSVAVILFFAKNWRQKGYAITLCMAIVIAIPLSIFWPIAFHSAYPAAFEVWWSRFALGPLNGFANLSFFHDFGYYTQTIFWYAWPAWPLAAWSIYRNRKNLAKPIFQLPLIGFFTVLFLLAISDRQSNEMAMPLLLPLAILGAIELDSLRRGAAAFLNWFGLMAFGLFGLLIWLGWGAMNFGWPERLAARARYFSPYYDVNISWLAALFAFLATLAWIWAVTRKHLKGRQAVTNWAAGITMVWGVGLTLWLPWLDAAKSYRPVVENMQQHVQIPEGQCVNALNSALLTRISWEYYAGIKIKREAKARDFTCRYALKVKNGYNPLGESGWQVLWSGHRPRDRETTFVLLERKTNAKP